MNDLTTPALLVDAALLDHNIDAMSQVRPGSRLRPHVKAFKSTVMARHVATRAGHEAFCCATLREMEAMADAGFGTDLLLANETLDTPRLAALAQRGDARVTVAVDSPETIEAAKGTGAAVLVDVDVGLPRCGCPPEDAGALADQARSAGIEVRGVMGYEGHTVSEPDRSTRSAAVDASMELLGIAQRAVGGGLTSAGGTGTYDMHGDTDEVQAGSYLLMDTAYDELGLPFAQALSVLATVISVSPKGWCVLDCGLKSLSTDHGNPTVPGLEVFFCSDEHIT
ncbi:MAG: alanine racemase, partial [Microthrixaceae bacterium]